MATTAPGPSTAASLSAEQLAEVLRTVKDGMRDEMSKLKRELAEDREAADERLLNKMKLEKAPTFKKKAHEKQYLFNEEVASKLEAATAALVETPPAVEKAKSLLEEGLKIVCERQKLIRIADRSEHGWATVDEYLEDELADNSGDEKRMQKAEFRAGRKLKAAAAKTVRKKSVTLFQKRSGQASQGHRLLGRYISQANGGAAPLCAAGSVPAFTPRQNIADFSKWPGALNATAVASPPLQGPCFNCGRVGHVKKFCPMPVGFLSGGK